MQRLEERRNFPQNSVAGAQRFQLVLLSKVSCLLEVIYPDLYRRLRARCDLQLNPHRDTLKHWNVCVAPDVMPYKENMYLLLHHNFIAYHQGDDMDATCAPFRNLDVIYINTSDAALSFSHRNASEQDARVTFCRRLLDLRLPWICLTDEPWHSWRTETGTYGWPVQRHVTQTAEFGPSLWNRAE